MKMDRQQTIDYIVQRLKHHDTLYQIETQLKIKDVDPETFEELIKIAEKKVAEEVSEPFARRNLKSFIIWATLTVFLILLFFFILPNQNITEILIASIAGSIGISFCAFNALLYYRSWDETQVKQIGRPQLDLSTFFAIALIPGIILYFVITWRFNNASDEILGNTQEDAVATIIDGSSVEGRRINFADITVKFKTKDGRDVVAVENVSTYKFKEFYKGQVLNIVYSKENPKNIDLLIDSESIQNLKKSEERPLEPKDLIRLIAIDRDAVTSALNSINFGWVYDSEKSVWINDRRMAMVQININELTLIVGTREYVYTFSKKLLRSGFVQTSGTSMLDLKPSSFAIFESDKYTAALSSFTDGLEYSSIIKISAK